ncbi:MULTISPECIES: hypothetical protein [Mycolicibacterium]|uniref:hypothetical protein n=1 Tax=Mycolicibacterium TaxID=1866885 RepID=UPI001CDD5760|nr:hypothetical protein [Mycolicibacterium fortuitum]UBV20387.1 hypothetical protein H8Z59_24435 [Mycolicibacterium fortuitum]
MTDSASSILLLPADTNAADWRVTLPLPLSEQQRIERQIATMPAHVESIAVRDSTITDLRVLVNSANAASDLAQIIGIVDAGPGHPLWLTWHIAPREDLTQQYDGSVDVGGCTYPDSRLEQHPENYLSDDERDLQDSLRSQYGTCPR